MDLETVFRNRTEAQDTVAGVDDTHARLTPLTTTHLESLKPDQLGRPIVVLEALEGLGAGQATQILRRQVRVLNPTRQIGLPSRSSIRWSAAAGRILSSAPAPVSGSASKVNDAPGSNSIAPPHTRSPPPGRRW